MEILSVPRVIISGTSTGVGKSLITLGLAHELRKKGTSISCAVAGPNLAHAMLLKRISGRFTRCFDERILTTGQMLAGAYQLSVGSDLMLIEGREGLYDGFSPASLRGSDAELAASLHTNVALVVDVRSFGASVGALIKGFSESAQGFEVIGAILNGVESGAGNIRDKEFYRTALKTQGLKKALGTIPLFKWEEQLPRGYVAQITNLPALSRQFLVDLGNAIRENVDIDELAARASSAVSVRLPDLDNAPLGRRCRIAVADDSCFNLCFQDNFDLLRYYGAEIVSFSPLADAQIPRKVGAVYLPGANLQEYGPDLSANTSMRKSLKEFAESGGAVYAEGAGSAYLAEGFRLTARADPLEGVGGLPGIATPVVPRFSYCEAVTSEESILGRPGLILKGISSNSWTLSESLRPVLKTLRLSIDGGAPVPEGHSPGAQILATFSFQHFGSNPAVAKNLADAAEVVQKI